MADRQHRRRGERETGRQAGFPLFAAWAFVIPAFLVVALGIAALSAFGLWPGGGGDKSTATVAGDSGALSFPSFVTTASAETQGAYRYAAANPELLQYIPCYCGCGGHSGHKSVRDCFLKEAGPHGVEFEEHGSTCDVCVGIVLDVQEQLAQGKSLTEARAYVDAEWSDSGPGTDTPWPPE